MAERIDLLFQYLAALRCPDIVTLQEVLGREDVLSLDPNTGSPVLIQGLTGMMQPRTAERVRAEPLPTHAIHPMVSLPHGLPSLLAADLPQRVAGGHGISGNRLQRLSGQPVQIGPYAGDQQF